jgi:DNA excision repair protein ERCC-2
MREASKFGFEKESNDLRAIYSSMDSLRKKKLKQADEAFVARKELIHAIEACLGMDFEDVILEFDHIGDVVRRERLKSYCGGFSRFLEAWFESDERYVGLVRKAITTRGREIFVYRLHCLDPSIATRDMIDSSHSVIAMSGTLTPTFLYRDVLGFDAERTELIEYPSVFPKENRLNLIVPGITSKYSRRGPEEYRKFASYLRRIIKTSPPNIAVFFPCYEMLNAIVRLIKGIDKEVLIEKRGMSKEQRTLLLARFREALNERGAVLFGVSGASFAEGVDYPGNMLKCVVIAGLPLERPDLKTKALIDYYQRKFKAGWAYGYIFPAVMRAVQAGGRCIRSSSDRGVVIFMDERFLWKNYLKAFPRDFEFSITKEPERLILDFWKAVL